MLEREAPRDNKSAQLRMNSVRDVVRRVVIVIGVQSMVCLQSISHFLSISFPLSFKIYTYISMWRCIWRFWAELHLGAVARNKIFPQSNDEAAAGITTAQMFDKRARRTRVGIYQKLNH